MTYDEFVEKEYKIYLTTTNDPMSYEDFVSGNNYLIDLYKDLEKYYDSSQPSKIIFNKQLITINRNVLPKRRAQ
mgnify:CR=1 FL=1